MGIKVEESFLKYIMGKIENDINIAIDDLPFKEKEEIKKMSWYDQMKFIDEKSFDIYRKLEYLVNIG